MDNYKLTENDKKVCADFGFDNVPESLEVITKEEWACDIAAFLEIDYEEAIDQLNKGEGYSSVSLPDGGMIALETNGDHYFFVSDMES